LGGLAHLGGSTGHVQPRHKKQNLQKNFFQNLKNYFTKKIPQALNPQYSKNYVLTKFDFEALDLILALRLFEQ
jgi:hypothetical protein